MFLFPYEKIKAGARIAIYGYGMVGRELVSQIYNNKYCEILVVIDKDAEKIADCPFPICRLEDSNLDSCEYVIISIVPENIDTINHIEEQLIKKGIEQKKLVRISSDDYGTKEPTYLLKGIDDEILHIGVFCEYGLGDAILDLYFVGRIIEVLGDKCCISFITKYAELFSNYPGIDVVREINDEDKFDIIFRNIHVALVRAWCPEKVYKMSKLVYDFCIKSFEFVEKIGGHIDPLHIIAYARINDKKRYNIYDPYGVLGEHVSRVPLLPETDDEKHILKKYNLLDKEYICVNRDVDVLLGINHPKLWPLEYYDKLISKIRINYKNIKLVQIGARSEENIMKSVDINLAGKTTLTELKALMRGARFLISGEGGLVHVMHFVGGKSVVIYGPTDHS